MVELVINLEQDRIYLYDRADYHPRGSAPGSIVSGPHLDHVPLARIGQIFTIQVSTRVPE
jgi:hypothetical protein